MGTPSTDTEKTIGIGYIATFWQPVLKFGWQNRWCHIYVHSNQFLAETVWHIGNILCKWHLHYFCKGMVRLIRHSHNIPNYRFLKTHRKFLQCMKIFINLRMLLTKKMLRWSLKWIFVLSQLNLISTVVRCKPLWSVWLFCHDLFTLDLLGRWRCIAWRPNMAGPTVDSSNLYMYRYIKSLVIII